MKRLVLGSAACAAMVLSASAAFAGIQHYDAVLRGAGHEHGVLNAILDTDTGQLSCTINYTDINAASGSLVSGGQSVPVTFSNTDNPIQAVIKLDKTQLDALRNGDYSFDLKGSGSDEIKGKVYRSDS